MQTWRTLGNFFVPDGKLMWMRTHAAVPFAEVLDEGLYKIYFSARDEDNRSLTGWIVVDLDNPTRILSVSQEPILSLPKPGFFDEDGIMGCQILEIQGRRHFYYIGWNRAVTVPFRNAIGLAVAASADDPFVRVSDGPIVDRSIHDNCFVASLCVLPDAGLHRMYYLSCSEWTIADGKPRHRYHIKYAESRDGIQWNRDGTVAIDFKYPNEYAISVPRVVRTPNGYRMWYSYRGGPWSEAYRIGYAESEDGKIWERQDDIVNLPRSGTGWDSDMQCYPFVFNHRGSQHMLYNGNGFGRTGIGLAVLDEC